MSIGSIKIFVIVILLQTGCSTMTPRTCEQRAWEAAGNAMSNVQFNLDRYNDYQAMINCSSANGCPIMPLKSTIDTGMASGKSSPTNYHGLSSREAYETALNTCQGK
jgi:hypothetical protein